ncbi:unnamed protein product [Closterium sp. Naga37s-1]|nr:unnamed protein product [Closterium sp. Naga37s-1]
MAAVADGRLVPEIQEPIEADQSAPVVGEGGRASELKEVNMGDGAEQAEGDEDVDEAAEGEEEEEDDAEEGDPEEQDEEGSDDEEEEEEEDEEDEEEGEEAEEGGPQGSGGMSSAQLAAAVEPSDYSFDEGNMLVNDSRPVSQPFVGPHLEQAEQQVLEMAQQAVQALAARLFALPATPHKMGRLIDLPPPITPLPREKPPPRSQGLTKWERFAREKGIQKRKRSKFVFEESSGEWKPRYGYKRANDIKDIPILEAKSSDVPGEDPFAKLKADKKARVKANERQRMGNLKASAKQLRPDALSNLAVSSASLPLSGRGPAGPRASKAAVGAVASLAAGSTASGGKFDRRLEGEKRAKKVGKHRKFLPVAARGAEGEREGKMISSVVDRVVSRHATDVMDVNKSCPRPQPHVRTPLPHPHALASKPVHPNQAVTVLQVGEERKRRAAKWNAAAADKGKGKGGKGGKGKGGGDFGGAGKGKRKAGGDDMRKKKAKK